MRFLLGILFLYLSSNLFSQNVEVSDSSARSKEIINIDILNNSWLYSGENFGLKAVSVGSSVSLMRDLRFNNSNLSFAFGAGVNFGNFHNNAKLKVSPDSSYIDFVDMPDSMNVKKNKLSVVNFNIPLELRYVAKKNAKNKYFKMIMGFNIGYLMSGYTKYIGDSYDENDGSYLGEIKVKTYRIKHLQKFNYGVYLKTGYGKVGLVFVYSFTNLFVEEKAPDLKPYSIGVSYTPF